MPSKYVDVCFYVVGESELQEAAVKTDLTIADLTEEIIQEFELSESENYVLLRENGTHLHRLKTIAELQIVSNDVLHFERFSQQYRQALAPQANRMPYLVDRARSHQYLIGWTPAIIGRSDDDQHHMAQLAVDLEAVLDRSISRKHAQITKREKTYYVESLSPHNLSYLNGRVLEVGVKRPLKEGDLFRPKKDTSVVLEFIFADAE